MPKKKLLIQLDTDPYPSMFDTVVGYDGGADRVVRFGGIAPDNVTTMVEGAIFTRSPKEKKSTAIFVGGSDLWEGEKLFEAVVSKFFADFRVSIMLDSNGSNTTAAAGVVRLGESAPLSGKRAVVLAGTGPVGQRAAAMLASEGARVTLTSRSQDRAEAACRRIRERFDVEATPVQCADNEERGQCIADAQIVYATGAAGVELLNERHWRNTSHLEALADANATPPLGIEGIKMGDAGKKRHDKIAWGAIGFGQLKLQTHRSCIAHLFTANDHKLDAEEIYSLTKKFAEQA